MLKKVLVFCTGILYFSTVLLHLFFIRPGFCNKWNRLTRFLYFPTGYFYAASWKSYYLYTVGKRI